MSISNSIWAVNHWKTMMMEFDRFDTDVFIDEVERRPAIWDMTSSDYKDRGAKKRCWEEIVDLFCSSAETQERKKTSAVLQKKWKNLRDSYVKELRKFRALPSGSGSKAVSTYIYFKRLQFLESSVSNKETTNNLEKDTTGVDPSYDQTPLTCMYDEDVTVERLVNGSSPGKKKLKLDPVDKHFADILEKSLLFRRKEEEQQDDEDRLFCLSLSKEMKKVPENRRLMAKIEIMNVIQRAQLVHNPPSHGQQYTVHSGYTGHTQALHSQIYPTAPSPACTGSAVHETHPVHHTHSYKEPHASTSRHNSQTPTLSHPPTHSPGAASSGSDTHSDYIDTF
ncbi:uncharacterized protein LOC143029186 isoform X2 [Oratosquilla oratoria]|uniref:uncharacterized protein LOC143029186 isoform X2 n=1 Tax=Oratosquilla oratoria TaxID=337810 RepID=UPI003F757F51